MNHLTHKQQQWLETIQGWQTSGVSQAEYCRRHQLSPNQFYHWKHWLVKKQLMTTENTKSAFVAMTIEHTERHDKCSSAINLCFSGIEFKYDHDTDPTLFLQLLNLLRGHHDQAQQ